MPGHVARVLAGLVGATGDDVLVDLGGERVARHQGAHHAGQQVVRAYRGQGAGVAAEGRTQAVVDIGSHADCS
ncbi:hypothetical protein D3C78_1626350 [compost metagenome]